MSMFTKWFTKPPKEQAEKAVAYITLAINEQEELLIEGDFLDNHGADMSKIIFLVSSGTLLEFVSDIVIQKCGKDSEITQAILSNSFELLSKYFNEQKEDSDDCPLIDPCDVFRRDSMNQLEEEDDD